MNNSVAFITLTMLCNYHLCLVQNISSLQKGILYLLSSSFPFSPLQPLAKLATNLLFISIDLLILAISYKYKMDSLTQHNVFEV